MSKLVLALSFLMIFFLGCDNKDIEKTTKEQKQTITVFTPNFDEAISGPIKMEVEAFEKKTNSTVRIVASGWESMTQRIEESLNDKNINYDIFVVLASWGGSILQNTAASIPQNIKEKIDWDDVLPIYKNNVLALNNKAYFLPYDGDNINLYYRKDIIENDEYKKRFKKEYGYELEVPKTWKEFNDIASFFNNWDWDKDGEVEYGFAGSRVKDYATALLFLTKAAAYAKHPDDKAYYFDINNMKAKIDNPGFVKALEEYIDIMKYAPKQVMNFSPLEVRQSLITGNVLMAIDWANIGTMSQNSLESQIKDKIGIAKLPGSNEVYNSKTDKWEKRYNAPSSIVGNWIIVVNKNSKNKKLAFDFAAHMTSKAITSKYVVQGWSGINPSRYSHLILDKNIEAWTASGFSKDFAKKYLTAINESLSMKNVMNDIRIPGSNLYYDVLEEYIDKAIRKELSAKDALEITASKWNDITQKLDAKKQLQFYKESINE
ncbi:ABC transporter substrate-binding protein [Arcobacter sp. LA11]|uniref:ABC transporter substrate-binding protein n=1 Tax=Arcobacter sp. LA11 TaxID=1898176 RepID=UPI0009330E2A|nr:extracellular solute-binding protein [Arcobacter sp. LA11]